jgi:hypothetical protein
MNVVFRFVNRLSRTTGELLLCVFWACIMLALAWWLVLTIALLRGSR